MLQIMGNKKRTTKEAKAQSAIARTEGLMAPGSAPSLPKHLLDELEAHNKQLEVEQKAAQAKDKKSKAKADSQSKAKPVALPAAVPDKTADAQPQPEQPAPSDAPSAPPVIAEDAVDQKPNEAEVAKEATNTDATEEDNLTDPYEDLETDAAVANIVREESNQLLQQSDTPPNQQTSEMLKNKKKRGFFGRWWHNKVARWLTIVCILVAIAAAAVIPESRYYILNTVGVRSSASVQVTDQTTRLPLKNVAVSINGRTTKTDEKGFARVFDITLGKQKLVIKQIAFAPITREVTIGWGSNPLGDYMLSATGVQYSFMVTDYLSGKPLQYAEVSHGEATAISDKSGKALLTLDNATPTIEVSVSAKNYQTHTFTMSADASVTQPVTLLPANKVVFATKQAGHYDIVRMNLDGSNREVLLPGTGLENGNIALATSPAGDRAAVVSTRENVRDADGFPVSTLTLVDVDKGIMVSVERGAQIRLIDWIGSRLIYQVVIPGESAADPRRQQIVSYDYTTGKRLQLASANQFQAVVSFQDAIYYSIGSSDPNGQASLFIVKPDGTGRQTIVNQEVWSLIRSSFDTLLLQTPTGWFAYKGSGTPQATTPPVAFQSRRFVAGPNGQYAWVDIRDNQGALIIHDSKTGKEKTVLTQDGLSYPVRWLSDTVLVYRVANSGEIADYAVSLLGGQPRKLTDVINSYGLGQSN